MLLQRFADPWSIKDKEPYTDFIDEGEDMMLKCLKEARKVNTL